MSTNKPLLYISYLTIFLLVLVTIFAFLDTVKMYNDYGTSYEVTTIIEGVNSTRTVTIWEKAVGCIIFLFLTVLLTLNVENKRYIMPLP